MTRAKLLASPRARQLVNQFEARVIDYTWMGGQPPEDWPAIERGYERAKKALLSYLDQLEARPPTVRAFTDKQDKHQ